MANEVDAAWAAGFFDGEGNVGIHKHRTDKKSGKYWSRAQVQIAQSQSPELLDRFQSIVGVGVVRGPYGPYGKTKPYYLFQVRGKESVLTIFSAIGAFLGSNKRSDFEETLKNVDG